MGVDITENARRRSTSVSLPNWSTVSKCGQNNILHKRNGIYCDAALNFEIFDLEFQQSFETPVQNYVVPGFFFSSNVFQSCSYFVGLNFRSHISNKMGGGGAARKVTSRMMHEQHRANFQVQLRKFALCVADIPFRHGLGWPSSWLRRERAVVLESSSDLGGN